jgi:predicted flap endonuclease-1-like 5' DNA nuclease
LQITSLKNKENKMKISDIQGIGPAHAEKLAKAGIRTTGALLKKGASAGERKEIEKMTGIGNHTILEWVNMADLYRIKGVGSQFSELLRKTGVDTVVELSKRVPKHLYAEMVETNQAKNLVNRMPTMGQVDDWVKQAKKLPRVISY